MDRLDREVKKNPKYEKADLVLMFTVNIAAKKTGCLGIFICSAVIHENICEEKVIAFNFLFFQ